MEKRFLSLLLCLVLVLGLSPTTAFAAEGGDTAVKAIQLVDSGTAANIGGGQADNIYFGAYQQSSDGSGYNTDPIKWRVLENADGQLFLFSNQNLDVVQYHTDKESVTWEKSTIRSWLNGYGAAENTGGDSGIDYTEDNFISTAFSKKEQAAIADTEVVNDDNPNYGTEGGNTTTDKIFLLSIAEANNDSYFADNSGRISTNTAYVAGDEGMFGVGEADYWWLRSPGFNDSEAAVVLESGDISKNGCTVGLDTVTVRPAFNLNLNSVLFTSAAAGGKSASGMDSGLTAVKDYTGTEWKLTLLDSSRNSFHASPDISTLTKEYGYSEWEVLLLYSNASAGANEYVSAMLVDSSNEVLYYGRLAKAESIMSPLLVTIPDGLSAGTYTLRVFNEQYNGDYKTDYASAFEDVTLTVTKKTPTLTLSANSGTVYSNAGTTSFTYSYDGDRTVSATSSDDSVATVSVDAERKTVTAKILQAGTATITVSANEGANYTAATAQTYELTVKQYVAPSYNDSDPTYAITVNKAEHGTVTASRRYAERGERVTLTVEPDKGWTLETLTVTDRNGKKIDLAIVTLGEKYTFQMPGSQVTVEATFMEDNTMLNYFVDVSASDYYYDAVLWAAVNGITSGVDALHFAPDAPCTRGQIVTFLWRAAGSPEPQTMSGFADVAADSYCAKAVAWAVERGITSGTGNGRFSPDEACTRAQAVTFLYRAAGSPAVSGYAEFDDVMTDAYYAGAVAWATEQGVTEGVGSRRFAPDDTCTRGQIVTFLWRTSAV